MDEQLLKEVNAHLQVIISLMLRGLKTDEGLSRGRDQIVLLNSLGLAPVTIAKILGKTPGYVSKELSVVKSAGKKKKKR